MPLINSMKSYSVGLHTVFMYIQTFASNMEEQHLCIDQDLQILFVHSL